jgi:hypothetical protein
MTFRVIWGNAGQKATGAAALLLPLAESANLASGTAQAAAVKQAGSGVFVDRKTSVGYPGSDGRSTSCFFDPQTATSVMRGD